MTELLVVELRVQAAARQKLVVAPDVGDAAAVQHDDLIRTQYGRQAMRDHDLSQQPLPKIEPLE